MNTAPDRLHTLRRLALLAAVLCFGVVVFGAFVRLSNAGLSCPDWPTCYGKLTWPVHAAEIEVANAAFERPVEVSKAWREQAHRMLAGALVLATFALAWLAWRARGENARVPWRAAFATAALIVFQALLGMWTVTLKLKPVIVMAHLLGGVATLALLVYIATRLHANGAASIPSFPRRRESINSREVSKSLDSRLRGNQEQSTGVLRGGNDVQAENAPARAAIIVAIALVAIQIALGGWTSANYAALACGFDFPKCLGEWWPATDFRNAFVLWRGIGVDYEGGVLDGPARAAIQLTHRLFAIVVVGHLLALGARMLRMPAWRVAGGVLIVLVAIQIALGIGNVWLGLPLPVATLHTAGAALLLALLVWMLARLESPRVKATA